MKPPIAETILASIGIVLLFFTPVSPVEGNILAAFGIASLAISLWLLRVVKRELDNM